MTVTVESPRAKSRRAVLPPYERIDGLHVVRVGGSAYEMGYQHGQLLREFIPDGPVPYFRSYLMRMMGRAQFGPFAPVAWMTMQRALGRRVQRALPGWVMDAVRGVSDGAQLPMQDLLDGYTLPDAVVWTTSMYFRARGTPPATQHRLALGLGCTSALAWGGATQNGALLHARNFDYYGVESWPKTATVAFHDPDDGQRYVSIVAAGIPLGGVTAMNASGLSLTVHQHMFSDQTRLGGTPIGVVGDEIMRHARDLDDAERILRAYTPIGCWTYLIADGRSREVLCWEESPSRRAPRRISEAEVFAYANIYLDPELGKSERAAYGSYWRHNHARHRRAGEMLEQNRGAITPHTMAAVLGNTGSPECRLHEAICMLMTVASVVFRPEDGIVWVAAGDRAPTSHSPFVPFSLSLRDRARDLDVLRVPVDADARDAFEAYRLSYLAWTDRNDLVASRVHLRESVAKAPGEALFHFLSGLLSLKALEARAAAGSFQRAVDLGHPDPERRASFHLWLGRAFDVAGSREDALKNYRLALAHRADQPVYQAAIRGMSRSFRSSQARSVQPDFAFADVVAP